MKNKLSYIIPILVATLVMPSCTSAPPSDTAPETSSSAQVFMQESADFGEEYIDSFIFLGESTTAHMKSRGVLKGGKNTTQVWSTSSGTMNLDTTVTSVKIVYPETKEQISIAQAVRRKKPQRMILTFGLNGAVTKIKKGKEYFKTCYSLLIDTVRRESPDTEIILQSCFPIAQHMDMSSFSVDAQTLLSYIYQINEWTYELCAEYSLGYLNTSEAIADENGFLRKEFACEDGYHLTADAYRQILKYIRTHAKKE